MADEIKAPLTRDERIAQLLDSPASDAVNAIKGPSLSDVAPIVQSVTEPVEEEETPTGGKKVRIPASRLKTLTTEVESLRAQAQLVPTLQERLTALESQITNKDDALPDWWKEAYGDNEVSRKGYQNQQRIMREEFRRELAQMEAQREAEEAERSARVEAIEESFDSQMDELEESLGRELTDNQKAEIMSIVGEYSPMEDDRYVAYMPISKAYELWQKGQGTNAAKKEMADIAGISSSGSTSPETSKAPPQWGDWRRRFGN